MKTAKNEGRFCHWPPKFAEMQKGDQLSLATHGRGLIVCRMTQRAAVDHT